MRRGPRSLALMVFVVCQPDPGTVVEEVSVMEEEGEYFRGRAGTHSCRGAVRRR